jgi:undecaprenyl-diphosphatase
MGLIETIMYGVLQGLTEFLPISSSGHLAVLNLLITRSDNLLFFFVILHLGTFFAILVFFLSDIIKLIKSTMSLAVYKDKSENNLETFRLVEYIAVATIVTVLLVFPFKDFVENTFNSIQTISINFCITGLLLLTTFFFNKSKKIVPLKLGNSIFIGIAQAVAVMPGISRSGATISAGIISGLRGEDAFRFSFLIALPAILGAAVLEMPEVGLISGAMLMQYIIGFLSAFFSGLISLWILSRIINKDKFYYFSFYCFLIGIALLIYIKIAGIN